MNSSIDNRDIRLTAEMIEEAIKKNTEALLKIDASLKALVEATNKLATPKDALAALSVTEVFKK